MKCLEDYPLVGYIFRYLPVMTEWRPYHLNTAVHEIRSSFPEYPGHCALPPLVLQRLVHFIFCGILVRLAPVDLASTGRERSIGYPCSLDFHNQSGIFIKFTAITWWIRYLTTRVTYAKLYDSNECPWMSYTNCSEHRTASRCGLDPKLEPFKHLPSHNCYISLL